MAEGRAGAFRLWKYYLDCVSPDGAACIGYVAGLRWGPLSLHYAALLEYAPEGTGRERHVRVRVPEPEVSAAGVEWRCAQLGVAGSWREGAAAYEARLPDDVSGPVHWRVIAPRAAARIESGPGRALEGWGYVERLELTVPPWQLPIDTMHWGRFHGESEVLVWLAWDGDVRIRRILHDGQLLAEASFGERVLRFEPGRELQLESMRTLREAPLLGVVAKLPRVLRQVPRSFTAAEEVKWLSRARLSVAGRPPASGWALHERVRFR